MLNVVKKLLVTICAYGVMTGMGEACSVNIDVTGETTVQAGADQIALGAKTSDCKQPMTFQWKLKGVGRLDEPTTDETIFYFPPSTVDGRKQAMISVTVAEANGAGATALVTLTIVGGDIPPTPTPEPSPTPTLGDEKLIFSEDFENGIQRNKGWEKDGNKIEIVDCGQEYGKCVKVSRTSPAAWTSLRKKLKGYSGTLRFEAMVKVENIVQGEKEWHRARFDTEISKPGEEQKRYPGHYYGEPFDWTLERFEADYLDGTETVELMISVLYTKGTIYVDNIKVYHRP